MPSAKQECIVSVSLSQWGSLTGKYTKIPGERQAFSRKNRKLCLTAYRDTARRRRKEVFSGLETFPLGHKRTSVYYCHPYTSCERGSNERLNRDIRRRLPKGTDFSKLTPEGVQAVEDWINAYPRKLFGFASAADRFRDALAAL